MPTKEWQQKRRQKFIASGVCVRCGKQPPRAGLKHCGPCLTRNAKIRAEHGEETRRARLESGICVECGKNKHRSKLKTCDACASRREKSREKYLAKFTPQQRVEQNRKWNEKRKPYDPARQRRWFLRKRYGITPEEWDHLFHEQGKRCAICLTVTPDARGWVTDHCHDTGVVRGILCNACNRALGLIGEDPMILQRAARYLVLKGRKEQRQSALFPKENDLA